MGYPKDEEMFFFGPGLTNQEMDKEFKTLYDSLIVYKDNIFHLVDTVCTDCDAGDRLARNIAERDTALLQRLVSKECEQRHMKRKAKKESVVDQLRAESQKPLSLEQILNARTASMKGIVEEHRK
ncbi:MAG TPA: hypothetical protein VMW03_03240 [Candidatus Krumholzibacteriaceae bacterium]|nr:hypothetical protein [Candidatus Krumholzibacteriaceae bacterium]